MRVIAGKLRSRSLVAPAGEATRPTSDRLRETLFNVLAPRMEGARFLDLYAGSGAVGIEALSRGASKVVLVEKAVPALKTLRANLERLGITAMVDVVGGSVSEFLKRERRPDEFDVVFLDPPYDMEREYAATLDALGGSAGALVASGGRVIAEHRRKATLQEQYRGLRRVRVLQQGDAALSFYEATQREKDGVHDL